MRYYAGNWAWSAWMLRGDSTQRLDRLKRAAPLLREQIARYSPADLDGMDSRGTAFRSSHLQGRALGLLLPETIDDRPFPDYSYFDGEIIAASVLGWNFGEGHLCDERLLAGIQSQCDFEAGELRVLTVESQPLFGSALHWRIVDARDRQLSLSVTSARLNFQLFSGSSSVPDRTILAGCIHPLEDQEHRVAVGRIVQTLQRAQFLHLTVQHVVILLLRLEQRLHRRWSTAEIHFFSGLHPKGFCDDAFAHNLVPFAATEAGTGGEFNDSLASEFHSALAGSSEQSCSSERILIERC